MERSLPGLLSPLTKLCAYGLVYALPIVGLFSWVVYQQGSLQPVIEALLGITSPYALKARDQAVWLTLITLLVAPAFIGAVTALAIEHRLDRRRKDPADVALKVMSSYIKSGGSAAVSRPQRAGMGFLIRRLSKMAEDDDAAKEFVQQFLNACDKDWELAEETWEELNSAMFACVVHAATRGQRLKGAETMARQVIMAWIELGAKFRRTN